MKKNFLKIEKIELWTRVGVLEQERKLGQLFNLDILLYHHSHYIHQNLTIKE